MVQKVSTAHQKLQQQLSKTTSTRKVTPTLRVFSSQSFASKTYFHYTYKRQYVRRQQKWNLLMSNNYKHF